MGRAESAASTCFCRVPNVHFQQLRSAPCLHPRQVRFCVHTARKPILRNDVSSVRSQLRGWDGGGSPRPPRSERCSEYWTNVGTVIDTLRVDYPRLFEEEISYDIYAQNIVFSDRTGNWVQGLQSYRTVIWAIRTQMKLFFTVRNVSIQSLFHCDAEGAIYVRWRVTVTPRVLALMSVVPSIRCRSLWIYDGLSVYKLNKDGWVCEHSLENNSRSRPKIRPIFEDVLSVGRAVGRVRERGTPVSAGGAGGLPSWYSTLDSTFFDTLPDKADEDDTERSLALETTNGEPFGDRLLEEVSRTNGEVLSNGTSVMIVK